LSPKFDLKFFLIKFCSQIFFLPHLFLSLVSLFFLRIFLCGKFVSNFSQTFIFQFSPKIFVVLFISNYNICLQFFYLSKVLLQLFYFRISLYIFFPDFFCFKFLTPMLVSKSFCPGIFVFFSPTNLDSNFLCKMCFWKFCFLIFTPISFFHFRRS